MNEIAEKVICSKCGVSFEEINEGPDNKNYCNACFSEIFNKCYECREYFEKESLTVIQRKPYCENCVNELFTACDSCGEWVSTNDSHDFSGESYCQSCFDERFGVCDDCDEVTPRNDLSMVGERLLCPGCASEYDQCYSCGRYLRPEDMNVIDGENYCHRCTRDTHYKDNVMSYDFKPKPIFFGNPKINELTFGFELETELGESNEINRTSRAIEESKSILGEFLYFKEDGSLENGVEFVSHPFTWKWWMENKEKFEQFLTYLKKNMWKSFDTESCGIHIHLCKNAFSTLQLLKFLNFFYLNPDFILKVSQRELSKLQQWASLDQTKDECLIYKAKYKNGYHKYTAVNLHPKKTIEVRIFKGTLNFRSFSKNIEFVMCLYEYCNNSSLKEVSIDAFKNFLEKNKKSYSNLYRFLN